MKSIQIVGSFITNYSFSRVNRGLALALAKIQDEYKVYLYREKEKIDRWPTNEDLKKHPSVEKLWLQESQEADVVIYNDYPKSGHTLHGLKDLNGKIKLMYLAWEESVYPKMWVDEINNNLHGMLVTATFVRDILRKAGVKVPIAVVPNGIDDRVMASPTEKYPLRTKKNFKFFHLSTARKRKGIDVLIKAYFKEFTREDDVCLVIKSFPGPDNLVNDLLKELQTEDSPEVEHIFNSEITDQELVNLINSCNCAVYPSRAEGFGLPIAEAMYHGIPVIATNYSGYLDFIDESSGLLVDYKLEDAKGSEMVNIGAKWAEPNIEDLREKMRYVYKNYELTPSSLRDTPPLTKGEAPTLSGEGDYLLTTLVANAKQRASELTWDYAAKKVMEFIKEIEQIAYLKDKKIGVIGRINSEDGVAEYTSYLYSNIENSFQEFYYIANKDIDDRVSNDGQNVVRIWKVGEENFLPTIDFIKEKNLDIVHIQYHSGFNFSVQSLDKLIENLKNIKVKVFVTLHAVRSDSFDFIRESKNLGLADKVFIHNKKDQEYAESILKNTVLFPIPTLSFPRRNMEELRKKLGIKEYSPILASHGLMNSNKNIPNVIEAINLVKKDYPDLLFLSINAVSSNNLASSGELKKARELVKKYNLENNSFFITDFLSVEQIQVFLQSTDIMILAYREVGETSSDAVRKCLCGYKPTIVTDIKQFSEFKDEVYKIDGPSPEEIADGLKSLLKNKVLQEQLVQNAKSFVMKNSYEKRAIELISNYKL